MADAADSGKAIYPVGGQTKLELGMPPTRAGVAIDLRSIDRVIDYPARDMTITVQAGTTIARLQALLRTENQRLPVDVPEADRATLGGAIATNTQWTAPLWSRHVARLRYRHQYSERSRQRRKGRRPRGQERRRL